MLRWARRGIWILADEAGSAGKSVTRCRFPSGAPRQGDIHDPSTWLQRCDRAPALVLLSQNRACRACYLSVVLCGIGTCIKHPESLSEAPDHLVALRSDMERVARATCSLPLCLRRHESHNMLAPPPDVSISASPLHASAVMFTSLHQLRLGRAISYRRARRWYVRVSRSGSNQTMTARSRSCQSKTTEAVRSPPCSLNCGAGSERILRRS